MGPQHVRAMMLVKQITDLRLNTGREHQIGNCTTRRFLDDELAHLLRKKGAAHGTGRLTAPNGPRQTIGQGVMLLGPGLRDHRRDGPL
jgi:hypothetical protein